MYVCMYVCISLLAFLPFTQKIFRQQIPQNLGSYAICFWGCPYEEKKFKNYVYEGVQHVLDTKTKTGRVPVGLEPEVKSRAPNTQFWTPDPEDRGKRARANGKMRASRGNCGEFKLFSSIVFRVLDVMSYQVLFQLILEITPNHILSLF